MSTFLFRLGRWCARHPFKTIGAWFLVAVAIFGASGRFGDELVDDYAVPGVESQDGTDVLEERFPEFAGASSRVVFHTEDGRIDDAENQAIVDDTIASPERGRRRQLRDRPLRPGGLDRQRRREDRVRHDPVRRAVAAARALRGRRGGGRGRP